MSGDPLVVHFAQQSQRTRHARLFAAICQLWIWLNAASVLAFRFWVVDRFNYSVIVEENLWSALFLIEGLIQLSVVVIVWLSLSKMPRDRNFWVFSAAAAFGFLVNAIIVAAWATFMFGEYRLTVTFAMFGSYLTIPALLFPLYCALVTPGPVTLWIYAVTVTVGLKCSAIIPVASRSQLAFIPYVAIILIALVSVVCLCGSRSPKPRYAIENKVALNRRSTIR
jgi:hypothetical protein